MAPRPVTTLSPSHFGCLVFAHSPGHWTQGRWSVGNPFLAAGRFLLAVVRDPDCNGPCFRYNKTGWHSELTGCRSEPMRRPFHPRAALMTLVALLVTGLLPAAGSWSCPDGTACVYTAARGFHCLGDRCRM